jgi:hypothetical protein
MVVNTNLLIMGFSIMLGQFLIQNNSGKRHYMQARYPGTNMAFSICLLIVVVCFEKTTFRRIVLNV